MSSLNSLDQEIIDNLSTLTEKDKIKIIKLIGGFNHGNSSYKNRVVNSFNAILNNNEEKKETKLSFKNIIGGFFNSNNNSFKDKWISFINPFSKTKKNEEIISSGGGEGDHNGKLGQLEHAINKLNYNIENINKLNRNKQQNGGGNDGTGVDKKQTKRSKKQTKRSKKQTKRPKKQTKRSRK